MHTTSQPGKRSNPIPLRGDDEGDIDFDPPVQRSDASQGVPSTEPKVWYARWGQAISGFFSSIGDKFTALWRGVSDAADAVARFFSGRGAESSVNVATMHIKETQTHSQQETSGATQLPQTPIIYFPVPKNEDVPEERRGLLGAIPVKPPISTEDTEKTEVVKSAPAPASPGQKKFQAYLTARHEEGDLQEYVLNEDCLQHAELVINQLFKLKIISGSQLSDEKKAIYEAAKDLRAANSDHKKRMKDDEQKKAQEAERIRQAEEAARKQPGQADFEDFLAAFERHWLENKPFIIHEGSKYLHEACVQYGQSNSENLSPDQKSALEYLTCWHRDPQGSKQRLSGATQFVNLVQAEAELTEPGRSEPMAVLAEALQAEELGSVEMVATAPPPPRPAPRWISVLANMKALEPQQITKIAGVLAMQENQITKAMEGLRAIANMASASGAPADLKTAGTHAIEQIFNYSAEANRRAADLLESLELAHRLVMKLKSGDAPVFEPDEQVFFSQLKSVINDVATALDKKLKELLPVRTPSAAQEKIRIPSLADLTDEQAEEGTKLFETYVTGYANRSNNANYTLPEGSNYFKPECLFFAKSFTDQVGQMQGTFIVDNNRLAASYYLLAVARQRGLIAA